MNSINEIQLLLKIKQKSETAYAKAKAKKRKLGDPLAKPIIKRSRDLIVPFVGYENNCGTLNNDTWAYCVPFGFREALDIYYSQLQKTENIIDIEGNIKKVTRFYCAWTQGCQLSFSKGDMLNPKESNVCLQVVEAAPMKWVAEKLTIDDGFVTYQSFIKTGLGDFTSVSQLEFLQLLIYGSNES